MQELIGKYLAGEATNAEEKLIDQWISKSEGNAAEFELHKKVWNNTTIRFKSSDQDLQFKEILNHIDQDQEVVTQASSGSNKVRKLVMAALKVAATLILFASAWYYFSFESSVDKALTSEIAMVHKQNPAGQKSKIFLPDGSEVWLNAESTISYPEKFSDSTREVSLEGEAFFNVIKNPDKPFSVTAGDVVTTVLGTAFNINAYNNDHNAYIALLSGKVKVDISSNFESQEIYLEPGEGIIFNRSSRQTIKEEFDEDLVMGWKDGKIKFNEASLEEVVSTLSRWYGVTISVENKAPEQWTYVGGPFINENLDNVLNSIGFTKEFTHEFDENNPKNVSIKFNQQ